MLKPLELEMPLRWGDMDAFGHVNNVEYLRYFETARVDYFMKILDTSDFDSKVKPVVASLSCDYKRPISYPDQLKMTIGLEDIGKSSFRMRCEMHSPKVGLAAVASCVVVLFDFETQKPSPIPADMRERFEEA